MALRHGVGEVEYSTVTVSVGVKDNVIGGFFAKGTEYLLCIVNGLVADVYVQIVFVGEMLHHLLVLFADEAEQPCLVRSDTPLYLIGELLVGALQE